MKVVRSLAVLAVALAAGCSNLSQRWELDHARVLAVRLSPPGLAAGERATVDVLVAGDDGSPAVLAPDAIVAGESDPIVAAAATVTRGPGGWEVVAGDDAAIAAARAAAGLAADAPFDLQLAAQVTVDGNALAALKRVRLGVAGANPPTPTALVGGAAPAGVATVAIGRPIALTLDGVPTDDDTLEFDWLTSTGALTGSETRAATLELGADDPVAGHVVALVRSEAGGVAWATVALTAE